jgi:SAM-dependent methyltransferase
MPDRSVLAVYGRALAGGGDLRLWSGEGSMRSLDVRAWTADADPADLRLIAACTGPTVDLGCGPGRLVAALAARGVPALGVDLSPRAVAMARRRGASAVVGDLFAPLPDEGRWKFALLVDGNIGIGGDPGRLLARIARLLAPGGTLLAEVTPEDVDRRGQFRIVTGEGPVSAPFAWAEVGAPALRRIAAAGGWTVVSDTSPGAGRRVLTLVTPLRPLPPSRSLPSSPGAAGS